MAKISVFNELTHLRLRFSQYFLKVLGVIYIVRTHKGGGKGLSPMRTIAYKGRGTISRLGTYAKKKFFGPQNLKTFLFLYKGSY